MIPALAATLALVATLHTQADGQDSVDGILQAERVPREAVPRRLESHEPNYFGSNWDKGDSVPWTSGCR